MSLTPDLCGAPVRPGDHVCWVVDQPSVYVAASQNYLADAASSEEKPVVFGPSDCGDRLRLAREARWSADPWRDVLNSGALMPDLMFDMFRTETQRARAEGYRGIRLMADMDWLLPLRPQLQQVVGFEALLDRLTHDLEATVVCAYRRGSFGPDLIDGVACVHRTVAGTANPPFRLFMPSAGTLQLSGEVDAAAAESFGAAVGPALAAGKVIVDASRLTFIDVAGFRALALAAQANESTIDIVGLSKIARRVWTVAGFGEIATNVLIRDER